MSRILIIEDERHLADGLRFNLEAEGYQVEVEGNGESGLERLTTDLHGFDALVLDVMLPGIDGFTVVSRLREANNFVPVLILTARSRSEDVLRSFESGADDYLSKPFHLEILVARLRGLLRRREWWHRQQLQSESQRRSSAAEGASRQDTENFVFDGKTIDFASLELHTETSTVRLTLMEAQLLRYLVHNAGRVVSRKSMLENVWGLHEDTDTRAIDNFIVRLRKYIEKNPSKPQYLLTVRGVGYRFLPTPG